MNISKVIHTTRIYIYIFTLLIFHNTAYSQGSGYGYGLLIDELIKYKDYREQKFTYEKKIKGMTSLRGYSYANTINDNAKRVVNSHFDIKIQKALAEYTRAFSNSKSEEYMAERYKNYIDKISEIEIKRNRDLQRLEQQYSKFIKVYSPYWSKNDHYD